jgi:hypothetical protein
MCTAAASPISWERGTTPACRAGSSASSRVGSAEGTPDDGSSFHIMTQKCTSRLRLALTLKRPMPLPAASCPRCPTPVLAEPSCAATQETGVALPQRPSGGGGLAGAARKVASGKQPLGRDGGHMRAARWRV